MSGVPFDLAVTKNNVSSFFLSLFHSSFLFPFETNTLEEWDAPFIRTRHGDCLFSSPSRALGEVSKEMSLFLRSKIKLQNKSILIWTKTAVVKQYFYLEKDREKAVFARVVKESPDRQVKLSSFDLKVSRTGQGGRGRDEKGWP